MHKIHHALVLNLHQPAGNLQALLDSDTWEAHEILYALDRIPRSLWGYEDVARVHLSFSGTLLETLADPAFQSRVYGVVDCGSLLWHFQNQALFSLLGTGHYHPVLPLIPEADREEHLQRWKGIAQHLFWRSHFSGFWPPEMGFDMALIPLLKRLGYNYVLVDSDHVEAVTPMAWQELRYRPHIARYGDDQIVVVVRDRELSDAQESGMDLDWFEREVEARTRWCDFTPLVTTATDGDNGGWFRNPQPQANFWGLYRSLLQRARSGEGAIQPSFIDDYLVRYGAHGEVRVNTGAWNTGWHHGHGFVQWTGSQAQKHALERISLTSRAVHETRERAAGRIVSDGEFGQQLEQALWHLLRAETSCNIFWGEAWVPRAHADLDICWDELNRARAHMGG
ncbi:MAG: glycoside hydrolase family 57 [Candidatus Thiodiazotropha sp.]